jgi:hypothetical protein
VIDIPFSASPLLYFSDYASQPKSSVNLYYIEDGGVYTICLGPSRVGTSDEEPARVMEA